MESNQKITSNFECSKAARTIAYSPQAKLSPRYPTLSPLFALDSTLTVYEPIKNTTFTPPAKSSLNQTTSSIIRLASDIGSPTPALSVDTSFYEAPYNERFLISNHDQTQKEEKEVCGSSYQIIHSNNFLSQPLFASPNPSLLSEAAGSPLGCSERTHYLDPEEFFERHCAQKSIDTPFRTPSHLFPKNGDLPPFSSLVGNIESQQADPPALPSQPLNIVSLTIDGDNLETDALFTFDVSESPEDLGNDVPLLQEEHFEASALIRGGITPVARTKYPDKLEALQSMAKRKAAAFKTKLPPRKDKTKQKTLSASETDNGEVFFPNMDDESHARDSSYAFGSVRISEALGWCKCKYSRCLKLYCDCFRNGMICGVECKCKKCQNTEQGNSPGGAATQARVAILERRPDAFESRVVKVGEGCSCKKNRCLKKYCACVADGLPCDDDRCSCIECENTVLARMSKRMKVNEDSTSPETKLTLVIDCQENDHQRETENDPIEHMSAATLAAPDTSTHEASYAVDEEGQIVTAPLLSEELTPVRYPTIEV